MDPLKKSIVAIIVLLPLVTDGGSAGSNQVTLETILDQEIARWHENASNGLGSKAAADLYFGIRSGNLTIDTLKQAAALALRESDTLGTGLVYAVMSSRVAPNIDIEIRMLEQAVTFLHNRASKLLTALLKHLLGNKYNTACRYDDGRVSLAEALRYYKSAESIFRAKGMRKELASILTYESGVYSSSGDFERSASLLGKISKLIGKSIPGSEMITESPDQHGFTELLTKAVELHDWEPLGVAVDSLVKMNALHVMTDSLRSYYRKFCTPMQVEKIEGEFYNQLGMQCYDLCYLREAIALFKMAYLVCEKFGNMPGMTANLFNQATCYLETGDTTNAVAAVARIHEIEIEAGDGVNFGDQKIDELSMLLEMPLMTHLEKYYKNMCAKGSNYLGTLFSGFGSLHYFNGDLEKAYSEYQSAKAYYQKANLYGISVSLDMILAQLSTKLHKPENEVKNYLAEALIFVLWENNWNEIKTATSDCYSILAPNIDSIGIDSRISDFMFSHMDSRIARHPQKNEIRAKLNLLIAIGTGGYGYAKRDDLIKSALSYWRQTGDADQQFKACSILVEQSIEHNDPYNTVKYLAECLKFALKTRNWNKTRDILNSALTFGIAKPVIDSSLVEENIVYKTTVTAIMSYLVIDSTYENDDFRRVCSELRQSLEVFNESNDKAGQLYAHMLIGAIYSDYLDDPDSLQAHYLSAFALATELQDTILIKETLDKALIMCSGPEDYLGQFEELLKINLSPAFKDRLRLTVADFLRNETVTNYYPRARTLLQHCVETAEMLNDPHAVDLRRRIGALRLYEGFPDWSIENVDSLLTYRPTSSTKGLANILSEHAGLLEKFFAHLMGYSSNQGMDNWSLNYFREMQSYVYLGCGNCLRSYAEDQYAASANDLVKKLFGQAPPTDTAPCGELFLMLATCYSHRIALDSLLQIYNLFQERLGGKVFTRRLASTFDEIYDILIKAYTLMNDPHLASYRRILVYDCLGFGDGTIESGSVTRKLGKRGTIDFPEQEILGSLVREPLVVSAKRLISLPRFFYPELWPVCWTPQGLRDVCTATADFEKNLFWNNDEKNRWHLLQTMVQTELSDFVTAESLLVSYQTIDTTEKWLAAVGVMVRGNVNAFLGRFGNAQLDYERARSFAGGLTGNELLAASISGNQGNLSFILGNLNAAQRSYDTVLSIVNLYPQYDLLNARILLAIGDLKFNKGLESDDKGNIRAALKYNIDALEKLSGLAETNTIIVAMMNMSLAENLLGNTSASDSLIRIVIDYTERHELYMALATALAIQGFCHASSGELQKAVGIYLRSVEILRNAGSTYELSNTLCLLGTTLRELGRDEEAYQYLKESIEIFEAMRARASAGEQSNFFIQANIDRYSAMISLLTESGKPEEAFSYVERSKAKSLKDAFEIAELRPANDKLRQALHDVAALKDVDEKISVTLTEELSKPMALVDSQKVKKALTVRAANKAQFLSLENQIIKLNPDYEALIKITSGQLAKIQPKIPAGSIFLEYYPAPEELYIFAVTQSSFRAVSVPVSRDSLYRLVGNFRSVIHESALKLKVGLALPEINSWNDDGSDLYEEEIQPIKKVLLALHGYLLSPVAEDIEGQEEVVIIPSGLLCYIPFHALASEKDGVFKFFIEEKTISYLTSSELIDIAQGKTKKIKSSSFLGFGNPDGSLPSAVSEIEAIKPLFPHAQVFTLAQATKEKAINLSGECNILHLATHAVFNDNEPDNSYIMLSGSPNDDGKWYMKEIFGLTWDKMNLVVLSACETALGKKEPGREVATLAYAFSVAGTPSIVASLWSVFDRATEVLMTAFYKNLKTQDKVSALQAAQIALLKNPRYGHPFFWAPFILVGDWR